MLLVREEVPDLAKLARGIGGNFEKLARGIERLWRVFKKLEKNVPHAKNFLSVPFLPIGLKNPGLNTHSLPGKKIGGQYLA